MKAAERREHLKESLIEAAERAIASRGLATLRARDLAQEVGCALGAIYNVFPDLDALIIAVNSRTLAVLDQVLAGRGSTIELTEVDTAVDSLVDLALRYLEFAAAHSFRWRALFQHRMPAGQSIPEFHLAEQVRLFTYIEEPLRALRPDLKSRDRTLLARSLFSAVHGIVSLGLEEKLVPMPLPTLKQQLAYVVRATANGIVLSPVRSARTSQESRP